MSNEEEDEGAPPSGHSRDRRRRFEELLALSTGLGKEPPADLDPPSTFDQRKANLTIQSGEQRLKLARHLAYGSLGVVGVQLLLANTAFGFYGFFNSWKIEAPVMIAWLSATVVQTLGIVFVIARSLFPATDEQTGPELDTGGQK